MPDLKPCLFISPIGEPDSKERRRSNDILDCIVRPALEPLGYKPQRADEISEPGNITSQVIQRLIDDPLVVADLSGRNANVFYELAVRHATKKPLIQLIQKGEAIPFDVAVMRTIPVDDSNVRVAEEAKSAIIAQVRAMEVDGYQLNNPIAGAIDLQALNQSKRPEDRSIATILEGITEIRQMMRDGATRVHLIDFGAPAAVPEWETKRDSDGSMNIYTRNGWVKLSSDMGRLYRQHRRRGFSPQKAFQMACQFEESELDVTDTSNESDSKPE